MRGRVLTSTFLSWILLIADAASRWSLSRDTKWSVTVESSTLMGEPYKNAFNIDTCL